MSIKESKMQSSIFAFDKTPMTKERPRGISISPYPSCAMQTRQVQTIQNQSFTFTDGTTCAQG